jgi:hypothetical protein
MRHDEVRVVGTLFVGHGEVGVLLAHRDAVAPHLDDQISSGFVRGYRIKDSPELLLLSVVDHVSDSNSKRNTDRADAPRDLLLNWGGVPFGGQRFAENPGSGCHARVHTRLEQRDRCIQKPVFRRRELFCLLQN